MTVSAPVLPANPFAPRRYGLLQKVSDRVYIFRNITNSSFVIGDKSVAVIDTQVNAPLAAEFLRSIRSVTDKPIQYVINTHYHWDHTNGNALFKKEGAAIVSSALTKDFMARRAPRQKEFLAGRGFELGDDPLLPEITFEGETSLDLGNMTLHLFFAGRAETDDATAIHVPSEEVVMSGDTVMTGSFPIFGQPVWDEGLEGDDAWLNTIGVLTALKPQHILPGHGPLAHEKEIELLLRIERYFTEEVRMLVQKNYELNKVLETMEPRLPSWIKEMPEVWGTPRYAILRVFRGLTKKPVDTEPGWQQFKPSAIPTKDVRTDLTGLSMQDFFRMAAEAQEGGDMGLRLSILKKAAQIFKEIPESLCAYAEALIDASRAVASVLEKGDFFQVARECWEEALRLDPDNLPALLGKGRYQVMMAYRGGDDPAQGMKILEKVIAQEPEGRVRAEAEFYLGMGYRRLYQETKAHAQFQKALSFDPAFMPAELAAR